MGYYSLQDKSGKWLLNLSTHFLADHYDDTPHTHHFLEISCIKSGASNYYVDGSVLDIRPYDVFLFNNQEEHYIQLKQGESLVNMVIHFEPEFIWNNVSNALDYGFLSVFFARSNRFCNRLDRGNPATRRIYDMMLDIEQEFAGGRPGFELMVKIKLQTIFVEIIREYDYIDSQAEAQRFRSCDLHAMREVFRYIEAHLADEIKLKQLASIASMSPAYFSTVFKKINGLTPFQYISQMRIQKSLEYIKTTDLSLTEIATMTGYNNSVNFIKAFKHFTGRTPSSYRKEV